MLASDISPGIHGSLMLDRVGLSVKNGWKDSLGRVFIYFVQKDVQKLLRCGHNRATAFMRELERFGLIERKRQGLGKPVKIYVKNFSGCENNAPENEGNKAVEPDQSQEKAPVVQQEDTSNKALFSASEGAVQTARTGQSRVPAEGSLDCLKPIVSSPSPLALTGKAPSMAGI